MAAKLTRDDAIALVARIMRGDSANNDEMNEWIGQLERDLACPGVSDLIFWPDAPMTATEIVDRALAYRPIEMGSVPPVSD